MEMSTFQQAHVRPEKGAATMLRHPITPFTSASPMATERMREVGVFSISRLRRRSRNPATHSAAALAAAKAAITDP